MSDGQQFEPPMEDNPPAPASAWQMLREAREERGLTIAEVAQHLKLTPRQVEAMEAGDLAHLPGPAFARGFVRNYARFLHIDPVHFNSVLDVVREVPQPINTLPLGQMPGPTRWRFSSLPALGIAAVLLALAVAGWYYGWFEPRDEQYLADLMGQSSASAEQGNSAPLASAPVALPQAAQSEPSAPVVDIVAASAVVVAPASSAPVTASAPLSPPPATASAPRASTSSSAPNVASVASAPIVAAPQAAASAPLAQSSPLSGPVPKGAHRLRFTFEADAWVEVRDANGKTVFSRLNAAGTQQEVQGTAPLQLVIGNAPQVRLTVDGKETELASRTSSNVARFTLP